MFSLIYLVLVLFYFNVFCQHDLTVFNSYDIFLILELSTGLFSFSHVGDKDTMAAQVIYFIFYVVCFIL